MTGRVIVDSADGLVPAVLEKRLSAALGQSNVSSVRWVSSERQVAALRDDVRAAAVLLTFIGTDWIRGVDDSNGLRRLLLTEAMLAGTPIVAVLINDAPRPAAEQLPDELRFLAHGEFHRIAAGSTVLDSIDEFVRSLAARFIDPVSARPTDQGAHDATATDRAGQILSQQPELVASVDAGWHHLAMVAERRRQERTSAGPAGSARSAASQRRRPGSSGFPPPPPPLAAADAPALPPAAAPIPRPVDASSTTTGQAVHLGVSAPKHVQPDRAFVARLVAYPSDQVDYARKLLRGPRRRSIPRLDVARCRWPDGATIEVRLSGDHLTVTPPTRLLVWNGSPIEAAFTVTISPHAATRTTVLRFEVVVNGIPLAQPHLEVDVGRSIRRAFGQLANLAARGPAHSVDVQAPTSAFASYSSKDRARVLDGVEALKAIGVDVFTDCLDLKAGEEFKTRIMQELLVRDLYVLFWSDNASTSEWVAWELTTVLDHRGEQPIRVNPLEPNVAPPTRLRHLNFSSPGTWIAADARRAT